MMRTMDEQRSAKLRAKLPHWAEVQAAVPSQLSLEQCSSEAAALYKASLAEQLTKGEGSIADLTGGLGVDSWALSRWLTFVLPSAMMTLVPSLMLFSLVRHIYSAFKIDNGVV